MEVRPVAMACATSDTSASSGAAELQHDSEYLQPLSNLCKVNNRRTGLQLNHGACRSSDRAAGQRQVAAAQENGIVHDLEYGNAAATAGGDHLELEQCGDVPAEPG